MSHIGLDIPIREAIISPTLPSSLAPQSSFLENFDFRSEQNENLHCFPAAAHSTVSLGRYDRRSPTNHGLSVLSGPVCSLRCVHLYTYGKYHQGEWQQPEV